MEIKELKELCETWTEYMQCASGSDDESYFVDGSGKLMFAGDGVCGESSEEILTEDINSCWHDEFFQRSSDWLKYEYMNKVLELKESDTLYKPVRELLDMIPLNMVEDFIKSKFDEKYDDVFKKADYLLHTL